MHHGIQRQRLVCATSFCVSRWFLSVTFQLFGMQKKWSNHGLMGCVRAVLLLFHGKSVGLKNNPHHYCAVFLTWLLLYIVVVFHYLNMCFLCVNLRLSVFSVICCHFPPMCTPLCISFNHFRFAELSPFTLETANRASCQTWLRLQGRGEDKMVTRTYSMCLLSSDCCQTTVNI